MKVVFTMDPSNVQPQGSHRSGDAIRDRWDPICASYKQYGVLLPNPTSGETNFGGVYPNMPYGPVYAYPAFPWQHEVNQSHNGGQWQ